MIPVIWFAYFMHKDPQFTSLSSKKYAKSPEKTVRSFTDEEVKKYTGINAFLKASKKTLC